MNSEEVRSLETLYKKYSGAVFGYLLHLSGNKTLADELTAETFYRAIRAVDGFRGDASVKTWLMRIVRNLYLRRIEREKRQISLDEVQERGVTFVSSTSDLEATVCRQGKSRIIQKAYNLPKLRTIRLRYCIRAGCWPPITSV